MHKIVVLLLISAIAAFSINMVYSQEMSLATFQETAQVIVDKSISQNVTASITLQSTSIQEIQFPSDLEYKIRENGKISAITLTNQNQCVLGVQNEACILINVKRNPADKNFLAIKNSTLEVSDQFIDELNKFFDTNAKLHSTYIHTDDQANQALETSGIISGKGIISAVYTMPMEDTQSMYEKISAILLPKKIRNSGGFYDVAKNLSTDENAKVTFSIIPTKSKSLLQLRLSTDYPHMATQLNKINTLELLKTKELKRSEYFSSGFYPLNSIIQVVVLSPEKTNVSDIAGNIVPTKIIDGEKIPTDLSKAGWVFDPEQGTRIQGKYIFGESHTVKADDLVFSLGGKQLQMSNNNETSFDESIMVVVIITIVAIAAAMFYLKGYKR